MAKEEGDCFSSLSLVVDKGEVDVFLPFASVSCLIIMIHIHISCRPCKQNDYKPNNNNNTHLTS